MVKLVRSFFIAVLLGCFFLPLVPVARITPLARETDVDGTPVEAIFGKDVNITLADASFIGELANDKAGKCVANASDVNGDGYDDFLVSAPGFESNTGKVYLIFGNATIGDGCAKDMDLSAANASFIGEAAGNQAGFSIAGAGDVNGDNYADILIGAFGNIEAGTNAGQVYLILGNATLGNGCAKDMGLGAANASFIGEAANNLAGYSVASPGDVNNDGYNDILIGAPGFGSNAGKVYLILGNATIGNSKDMGLGAANASFIGEVAGDQAGWSVAGTGDVNGDGYNDTLIGAYGSVSFTGKVYLVLSNATIGNSKDMGLGAANASFIGEVAGDRAGYSVAGAGDVNGDGHADILIGAINNDAGGGISDNYGQVYLILGNESIGDAKDMGLGAANASFIGEVNGDRAGWSVAGAGDINNDGYADILIGAIYNNAGGSSAGKVYLILGNATIGNSKDMGLGAATASLIGEVASGQAGTSVASAGDVNADGYIDILIGASATGAGKAYLLLGWDFIPVVADAGIANGTVFGATAPAFELSVFGAKLDEQWYSINGGMNVSCELSDDLSDSQYGWETLGNGSCVVSFWANDSSNRVGQRFDIFLRKDIIAPTITSVGLSDGQIFCNTTEPTFNLGITEANRDEQWYSFNNGATNNSCGMSGSLDGWAHLPNGSVIVSFWASDTTGNVSTRFDVLLHKDTEAPAITINTPAGGTEFTEAPSCMLTIVEANLDKTWYTIGMSTEKHYFTGTSVTIDATAWSVLPAGAVTIHFYAIDTMGNEQSQDLALVKVEGLPPWLIPAVVVVVGVVIVAGIGISRKKKRARKAPFPKPQ